MGSGIIEVIVHKKTNPVFPVLRVMCIAIAVVFILLSKMTFAALIIAVPAIFLAWYFWRKLDVDYEYCFVDGELRVSRIMNKSKRKDLAKYDISSMEAYGPVNSIHLDSYKNRTWKDLDYSSGEIQQPDVRYYMYLQNSIRLILEPTEELTAAIRQIAPRKVFLQ